MFSCVLAGVRSDNNASGVGGKSAAKGGRLAAVGLAYLVWGFFILEVIPHGGSPF